MRKGCSTKILIPVIIVIALTLFGFIGGNLGSALFGTEQPNILEIREPHIQLPAEGIAHISFFTITNTLLASWLTIIVLFVLFFTCTRKMKLVPGRWQGFAEFIVEALLNFVESTTGDKKKARTVFPIVATIFLYVLFNAYLALMPFFGTIGIYEHGHFVHLFRSANTDFNVPFSIAIVAFLFIEYLGVRSLGGLPYLNTFFNIGQLRDGIKNLFKGKIRPAISGIFLGFINFCVGWLEILSHVIRVVSFTFRLFGNMTAGEILLLVITFLVPFVATIPFYGLELLVGFLQAMIFAGLTLVFCVIAMTSHHEEESEHEHTVERSA